VQNKVQTLEQDAVQRLELFEKERQQLGHASPSELYLAGYVDALCQAQGKMTRSNVDWSQQGVARMFNKSEVQQRIDSEIRGCDACSLAQHRTQAVPGAGPLWTPLAIVGEAPGKDEDEQGAPFVGRSGQLYLNPETGLIPLVTGYQRENIRIENCVRCRPPGNRNPNPEEVLSCKRYLRWSLLNIQPKVIIALGKFAASWFAGQEVAISAVRGKAMTWEGITVVATYHPAYRPLLQGVPSEIEKVKSDLQRVVEELRK